MFVKIENKFCNELPLIINVDCISTISPVINVQDDLQVIHDGWKIVLNDGREFNLNDEQYYELCRVLTKRL